LVDRYGRRALDVAAKLEGAPQLKQCVVAGEPDVLVEFAYQREQEMAMLPADHWLRRTRLGLFCAQAPPTCQPGAAEVA
jgi:glycerol-3-phosphate dehydrogenase